MHDLQVTQATPQPFAYVVRKARMTEMPKVMGEGFGTLSALFQKARAPFAGGPMAHYLDYDAESATFELGFPAHEEDVDALAAAGLSIGRTPGGQTMTAIHVGPYDTIVKTYDAMTREMAKRSLKGSKDMWEVYFSPPETPPEEIKTEVVWPVTAAA
jgi:hypothetical protein